MPKYEVHLSRTEYKSSVVVVEAVDEVSAQEAALEAKKAWKQDHAYEEVDSVELYKDVDEAVKKLADSFRKERGDA